MRCFPCEESPKRICALHARTDNLNDEVDVETDKLKAELAGADRALAKAMNELTELRAEKRALLQVNDDLRTKMAEERAQAAARLEEAKKLAADRYEILARYRDALDDVRRSIRFDLDAEGRVVGASVPEAGVIVNGLGCWGAPTVGPAELHRVLKESK